MNRKPQAQVQELSADQIEQVSGGILLSGSMEKIAVSQPQYKLALRIMSEHMERNTQVVQKITS